MSLKFPNQDKDSIIDTLLKHLENFKLPSFDSLDTPNESLTENIGNWFTVKRAAAMALFLLIMIFGISTIMFSDNSSTDSQKKQRVHFKIKEGMDAREIARILEQKGVIDSGFKFRMLAKLNGYEDQLKVGSYNFTTGMKYDEVFEKLLAGEPELVTFTIPEGFGVKDIAKRLAEIELVDQDEFLKKAETFAPYDYIEKRKNVFYYCEGFLFPDTYEVENNIEVDDILKIMAEDFDYRLTKKMRVRAAEENMSIYDLITLASIVEKEVRYAEDRPIVAQVFFKRLKIGMPLQTDASLQYLMDAPKEDVSIADTQMESPYNTYQHAGLPPGPIANPGLDAIEAVLNPANTDYLYFVADRSGHNHYSYTYDEHLNLVNQYR